jgi:hypothetical protein
VTTVHGVLDGQISAWLSGPNRLMTRVAGGPASEDAREPDGGPRIVVDGRGVRGLVGGTINGKRDEGRTDDA